MTTGRSDLANSDKAREARLRRMAQRQGLALMKSHRRDPQADDYGRFRLVDTAGEEPEFPSHDLTAYPLSFQDVERALTGE